MSLFSNLRTASSGLAVSSTQMSVIGDNIANVNTIGFKRGRASFSDSFPVDVSYVHGPISIGTGAFVGATSNEFSQGSMQISNNNLHMAVSGNGFFTVREGSCNYYTRNGEFSLNSDGYIVNPAGLHLQGFLAQDGVLQPQQGDLQVNLGDINSEPTTTINLTTNLNSEADDSTTPLASLPLDGASDDISDIAANADFATSIAVYDSLGAKHDLTIAFEKTATNTWTAYVVADGGDVIDGTTGLPMTDGKGFNIATIDMTFDSTGELTGFVQTNASSVSAWNFAGADAADFEFEFGQDADGDGVPDNTGNLTQLASESTITSLDQDGFGVGHLTSLMVQTDGRVVGRYDNGQDIILGQVSVATFDSTSGLERMGGNLFRATRVPGEPTYGVAGEGGRGDIFGSSLEASNVDIEDEFVNMITAQRSYQANSRVMSATNELLRELVNLV